MKKEDHKSQAETTTLRVTGIVIPIAWDGNGNATHLAISAHGEHEYVIDRRAGKGREMAKLLREWIQADGLINEKGAIIIKRYTIIENASAPMTNNQGTITK